METPSPQGSSSMESLLQEFKEAEMVPEEKVFCHHLSEDEHKEITSMETQKHLEDLRKYLEKNPESYTKVLRKRKIEEIESQGFLPWLKLKILRWLHGDNCPTCILQPEESNAKLESLKRGMMKVYDYAEASRVKDRSIYTTPLRNNYNYRQNTPCTYNTSTSVYITPTTTRKRPRVSYSQTEDTSFVAIHMARDERGEGISAPSPRDERGEAISAPSPAPPPPLPSRFFSRKEQLAQAEMVHPPLPPTPQPNKHLPRYHGNTDTKPGDENTSPQPATKKTSTPKPSFVTPKETRIRKHKRSRSNTSISSTTSRSSLLSDIKCTNPLTRLRTTLCVRSPGGTPARPDRPVSTEPLHQALTLAFQNKFRNVRTPSPLIVKTAASDRTHFSPQLSFTP